MDIENEDLQFTGLLAQTVAVFHRSTGAPGALLNTDADLVSFQHDRGLHLTCSVIEDGVLGR
ncbi:hypothetical protein [Ktedonobacter sp. SOSP1-52]|uniref:hypothetical protein n=1 Tax=Ktedonobacter sp. SOSP1-52 TaxID=2778366 RepID=UPI00191547CD|nr:hypothetical protein [Ktedonobacter sp. SOSP1-52]